MRVKMLLEHTTWTIFYISHAILSFVAYGQLTTLYYTLQIGSLNVKKMTPADIHSSHVSEKSNKVLRIFIGTACIILGLSFICDMQFCHLLHLASWRLCIIHCRSVVRSNLKRWHLLAVISSNHQPCSYKRKLLRSTSVLTRFSNHVVIGTTCSSPSRERSFPNPAACRSLFATIDWPIDSALYKASPI